MNGPVSNDAAIGKRVRKRRTWYRRRLRMRRILLAVLVGTVVAGACWQNAVSYFSPRSSRASQVLPDSLWFRGNVHKDLAWLASRSAKPAKNSARIPGVYPYSVIPGGVKDVDDLRYATLRDYVIRQHYAHFDFNNARLLRSTEARQVYLSYRIRDAVYWTRRKIRLQPGELLLTDGKITARARCGNQISDTAKPEVSAEEPEEDVLDQPVAAIEDAPSLTPRPVFAAPELPTGQQPNPPHYFGGGFIFPYVTVIVPVPSVCPPGETDVDGHCKHKRKHPKSPIVPEPSTMVLLASGLGLILWHCRKTASPITH